MSVTITLLNFRESCVPEFVSRNELPEELVPPLSDGMPLIRQYRATIQYLVEGETRLVLQHSESLGDLGDTSIGFNFGEFSNIQVDESNFFVPDTDLHIPGTIPENSIFVTPSEIICNYDKHDYGKMNLQVTLDVLCPKEYFSGTGGWTLVPTAEEVV